MVFNIHEKGKQNNSNTVAVIALLSLSDKHTDAEEDLVDVNGGEVQEEEGEVDNEEEEAQNHTHPLLETFT